MSRIVALAAFCLLASTALVARGAGKDDVQAAVKKLADAPSYAWKSETKGGFGGGTAEGKAEKDGFTVVTVTFLNNNNVEVVKKGDQGAVKLQDGWKSFAEVMAEAGQGQPNPARFVAMMMRNYRAPAVVAQQLVSSAKEVKQSGDVFEAELTEPGAKDLISFRGRQGGDGPQINDAKGTAKLWVKDGVLSKLEYHLQGSMNLNGQDREIDRTTTIEIKDVGTAKPEVPEEAKKKIS